MTSINSLKRIQICYLIKSFKNKWLNMCKKEDENKIKFLRNFIYENNEPISIKEVFRFLYLIYTGKYISEKQKIYDLNNKIKEMNNIVGHRNKITCKKKLIRFIRNYLFYCFKIKVYYNKFINNPEFDFSKNKIKYILISEAPPFDLNISQPAYIFANSNNVGNYRTQPYKAFGGQKNKNITGSDLIDIFNKNGVGFFDLFPFPIPVSSKIRNAWSFERKFQIHDKPFTVVLFELGLNEFLKKIRLKIKVNKKIRIAFMMPPNSSVAIFGYYSKMCLIERFFYFSKFKIWPLNLVRTNSKSCKFKSKYINEIVLPLYQANVLGSSNTPNEKLIKHAFNL